MLGYDDQDPTRQDAFTLAAEFPELAPAGGQLAREMLLAGSGLGAGPALDWRSTFAPPRVLPPAHGGRFTGERAWSPPRRRAPGYALPPQGYPVLGECGPLPMAAPQAKSALKYVPPEPVASVSTPTYSAKLAATVKRLKTGVASPTPEAAPLSLKVEAALSPALKDAIATVAAGGLVAGPISKRGKAIAKEIEKDSAVVQSQLRAATKVVDPGKEAIALTNAGAAGARLLQGRARLERLRVSSQLLTYAGIKDTEASLPTGQAGTIAAAQKLAFDARALAARLLSTPIKLPATAERIQQMRRPVDARAAILSRRNVALYKGFPGCPPPNRFVQRPALPQPFDLRIPAVPQQHYGNPAVTALQGLGGFMDDLQAAGRAQAEAVVQQEVTSAMGGNAAGLIGAAATTNNDAYFSQLRLRPDNRSQVGLVDCKIRRTTVALTTEAGDPTGDVVPGFEIAVRLYYGWPECRVHTIMPDARRAPGLSAFVITKNKGFKVKTMRGLFGVKDSTWAVWQIGIQSASYRFAVVGKKGYLHGEGLKKGAIFGAESATAPQRPPSPGTQLAPPPAPAPPGLHPPTPPVPYPSPPVQTSEGGAPKWLWPVVIGGLGAAGAAVVYVTMRAPRL